MSRIVALLACVLCAAVGAAAQEISVGVEARRDRLEYHFDNPSSFDTPALVPHFFEQRYDADNVWLVATARYGQRWATSFGVTPRRDTTADDYDTFFDPGSTTWVTGTSGPARVRSWSVAQLARIGGTETGGSESLRRGVSIGYRLRIDAFDFGVGHKTVTRNGRIVQALDVTSRESTRSQLHEAIAAMDLSRPMASGWTISARGEIAPLVLGRLSVRLPDKYPGQDLVFIAKALGASGRAEVTRKVGSWAVAIDAEVGRTWSYRSTDTVHLASVGATISAARRW